MAKKAGAAVLLVADIDRGGVFAATIGAFHLLTPRERRLLGGFIINKFRGDAALFEEGVTIIERRTRRPVLGVVPYAGSGPARRGQRRPGPQACGRRLGEVRWPPDRRAAAAPHLQLHRLRPPGAGARGHPALPGPAPGLAGRPGPAHSARDQKHHQRPALSQGDRAVSAASGLTPRAAATCWASAAVTRFWGRRSGTPWGWKGRPRTEIGLGLLPVVTTLAGAKTTTQVQARVPERGDSGR